MIPVSLCIGLTLVNKFTSFAKSLFPTWITKRFGLLSRCTSISFKIFRLEVPGKLSIKTSSYCYFHKARSFTLLYFVTTLINNTAMTVAVFIVNKRIFVNNIVIPLTIAITAVAILFNQKLVILRYFLKMLRWSCNLYHKMHPFVRDFYLFWLD